MHLLTLHANGEECTQWRSPKTEKQIDLSTCNVIQAHANHLTTTRHFMSCILLLIVHMRNLYWSSDALIMIHVRFDQSLLGVKTNELIKVKNML